MEINTMYKCPLCKKGYASVTDMAKCTTKCAERIEKENKQREVLEKEKNLALKELVNLKEDLQKKINEYNAKYKMRATIESINPNLDNVRGKRAIVPPVDEAADINIDDLYKIYTEILEAFK